MTPTVSVLMPVHNAEPYLARAVDSILGQTFAEFEFLIIDDGSTDRSRATLAIPDRPPGRRTRTFWRRAMPGLAGVRSLALGYAIFT